MAKRVSLAPKLDTAATAALRDDLLNAVNDDLIFDASNVEHLGALTLELLISASVIWRKAGKTVTVENISEQMVDDLSRYGLTPDSLQEFAA